MTARAPILGIAGLIFLLFGLLSHWLTYVPAEGFFSFGWYSLTHIAAGIVFLAWYFVSGTGSAFQFLRARSTRYGANAILYTAFFVVVIVMLNFLGTRYHKRVDLSVEGVNTLSPQSCDVLDQLAEDVKIDVFLQAGRDPVLEELFDAFKDRSKRVAVRFVDPQVSPEVAQEAGITQVPSIRIRMGDRNTVITETDEDAVTNAIQRVSTTERKKIYFVDGHGEPAIDDSQSIGGFGLFADSLRKQNYVVEKLFLPEVQDVAQDAAALVVTATEKDYFPQEIEILDRYIHRGGRVMFLLEPREGPKLVDLVSKWGVNVGNDVIVDQQMRLFEGVTLGLDPVVSDYGDHPSVKTLKERSLFSIARSVRPAASSPKGVTVTPIAYTAKTSWAETDLDALFQQSQAQLSDADIPGPVSIAVAAAGFVKDIGGQGDGEFEIAVFGDSTFATNKYWRQLFNDALVLSVTGWLAGEPARISIGSRVIRASRAHLTPAQARSVFYLSVLVIPELILLLGVAVWWRRSAL
jgi:gliding motility-associatede transport system auxiliary component